MTFSITFSLVVLLFVVSSDGYSGDDDNCKVTSNGLTTIGDVQNAIDNAKVGDTIILDPIKYRGNLLINRNSLADSRNNGYITIKGVNQCNQNTEINGKITIEANNWKIDSIVFKDTDTAIEANNVDNIGLSNLVLDDISGNGIVVESGRNIQVDSLVAKNIRKNVLDFSRLTDVKVKSTVIKNSGLGLNCVDCKKMSLDDTVIKDAEQEAVKITGNSGDIKINSIVINGDSPKGQGWMYLEGDNYSIMNAVCNGGPVNGIVVNGCNNQFDNCVFGIKRGNAYSVFLQNKQTSCRNQFGYSNVSTGGRGLHN